MKTEKCAESSNGVCVCGWTHRDGNKIFSYGICGGLKVNGFTWVSDTEEDVMYRNQDGWVILCSLCCIQSSLVRYRIYSNLKTYTFGTFC
ncbi:hypothetical protein DPMN_133129 [Dreissena polymorpha]|uniref:Uncharacterized protein n=1 Tax=Dreissena polymorpha TaxID=45954 RepID=A0A9D4FUM8_DREPO|nr:hypothetical protein DPMN_133129 [Dreissena polymorpha]